MQSTTISLERIVEEIITTFEKQGKCNDHKLHLIATANSLAAYQKERIFFSKSVTREWKWSFIMIINTQVKKKQTKKQTNKEQKKKKEFPLKVARKTSKEG